MLSLWEVILNDDAFPFPDFSHEAMTVQDCWRSRENRLEQDAVRALLSKMNISIVEAPINREHTDFCGTSVCAPAPVRNLKLAPKRFVENAAGRFLPHDAKEQKRLMEAYCSHLTTDKIIAYCHYCTQGLNAGGKRGLHLAELLFTPEKAREPA